jgi:hypothetical protein
MPVSRSPVYNGRRPYVRQEMSWVTHQALRTRTDGVNTIKSPQVVHLASYFGKRSSVSDRLTIPPDLPLIWGVVPGPKPWHS